MAGLVLRFSGFIQARRPVLACLRVAMEEATSVKALASRDRAPKSSMSASSISVR